MKRHNKKRNSALLYEFLIKHISKCLVESNKADAAKALSISKKYFAEGTPLRRELDLFGVILKTNVKNKESAQKILEVTRASASKMNARLLDEQKSKLIKEINYTFAGTEVYNYKIPNYMIYASVQTLLNEARNKKPSIDIVTKVKLEESIVDYLTRTTGLGSSENPLKVNPNYSNTVYNFLMQRFHKKYEGKLNEHQRKLLMQYTTYLISNNEKPLKEYLAKEVVRIKTGLKNIKDSSLREDKDIMAKINECLKQFSSITVDNVNETNVLEVLQHQKLLEEVES